MTCSHFGLSYEIYSVNYGQTKDCLDILLHKIQDVSHQDDLENFDDAVVEREAQLGEGEPIFEND